jgi:hypothetical protein
MIGTGATPSSTHRSSAAETLVRASAPFTCHVPNLVAPGPPLQCCMPGTRYGLQTVARRARGGAADRDDEDQARQDAALFVHEDLAADEAN